MMSNTQSSPINKRRSIEELKMKYEASPVFETPKIAAKPKSPKKMKKSLVKQMASMFNSKMSQIVKRETEVGKYAALVNEFSPEPKPQPTAIYAKPVPMPRTRFTKTKAPVPSPRIKTLVKVETKPSACFVAEDVFAKLSVKDKAQLYTQFVEEMSKKNPQFGKHAGLKDDNDTKNAAQSEVIAEKQATVKNLLEELEFNTVFPKSTKTGAKSVQRMDSMKKALAARKNSKVNAPSSIKAKEFEDILDEKKPITQEKAKSMPCIQTTNTIFQNQPIENLFFSWFKEKHENDDGVEDMSNHSEVDEEKQKSAIDRLLEEAIAKLENLEAEQNTEAPKPMPRKKKSTSSTTASSATTSAAEESESGLSSLPKNTSEESQTESQQTNNENTDKEFEFAKPLKPLRKRKLRRNPIWKKDVSQLETNQLTSTDSESDSKLSETKLKNKKLFMSSASQEDMAAVQTPELEASLVELHDSLMRVVNSPRKIKSAYTLTVLETPLSTPRTSLSFAKQPQLNKTSNNVVHFSDSFTDQGFETATNEANSPLKRTIKPAAAETTNTSLSSTLNTSKQNFGFSTPIKTQEHHSFAATCTAKQQLFSPICKPVRSRRKSLYDIDSRRNSLAMQVIREDQPLEPQQSYNSKFYSQTEQKFFANAPTMDMTKDSNKLPVEKSSQFWIKCGDFSVALDINYNDAERLRLLYEIFSQTSCDTKDLHFGIDNHKFSVHGPLDMGNTSARLPVSKGCSHYWFSTGDLAIPFSGKYLNTHKIQRLFRIIKETVEETGILRFGVDAVEFSNVPEFWYQPAKLSVDSQYSMLVGLQSGESNGLEGRSKYAWPHSKPVKISDLDQSDYEADSFEEIEGGRLSFSPFGSNHYDLASLDNEELSMPRNSQAMMSLDSYCHAYESEPLDHLFDDSFNQEWQPTQNLTVPEMVVTVQNEQQRLSQVQEQLAKYVKPSYIAKDCLDKFKGTPEYLEKLKSIVSDISNIGCSNNFKECSAEELESYMYFLGRYAEICLSSCNKHMDTVLEALSDHRAVVV